MRLTRSRPTRAAQCVFRHFLFCALGLALGGVPALPAWADLVLQGPNNHSGLVSRPGQRAIRDDDFAALIKGVLIDANNQSTVKDAKFLFQQCFGGGMLDDLGKALGNTVNWVGGSAAQFNQPAYGQVTRAEAIQRNQPPPPARSIQVSNRPQAFWTSQLLQQFGNNPNQTFLGNLNAANAADPIRGFGPGRENPQSVFGGTGNTTITLKDPTAASHHAVLFAGQADYQSIFNGMNDMRNLLIQQWGDPVLNPNVTITMLYGDGQHRGAFRNIAGGGNLPAEWGARPADRANLVTALNDVKARLVGNPNEEFFFYGFDHGASTNRFLVAPRTVARFSFDDEVFSFDPDVFTAILEDPDNVPTVTVQYSPGGMSPSTPVHVSINGFFLGDLDPFVSEMSFEVPESFLQMNNVVRIDNTASPNDLELMAKEADSGAIALNPFVPEPPILLLVVIGLLVLVALRYRRAR